MHDIAHAIICPRCKIEMVERHGKSGPFLGCVNFPNCKTSYTITENTRPFRACDSKTRHARHTAHKVFDKIWQSGFISRGKAYSWLAASLKIPNEYCHFSMFDYEQCQKAIEIAKKVNLKSLGL